MLGMEHILLLSCGTSPQVVTETLWALATYRKIVCTHCYILTTPTGYTLLQQSSFHKEWKRLSQSIGHPLPPSLPLDNISIIEDFDTNGFADRALELVHRLTSSPETTLHVALAGGRKHMSVLLGFALSLLGRPQDRLYHVLASDDYIASGAYFPGEMHDSQSVQLVEIPYVRLRLRLHDLFDGNASLTYSTLVATMQQELDLMSAPPTIMLDVPCKRLCIGNYYCISLSLLECAVYAWAASAAQPIAWGKHLTDAEWQRFVKIYRGVQKLHRHNRNHLPSTPQTETVGWLCKPISNIKRKLRKAMPKAFAERFQLNTEGPYGRKHLVAPPNVEIIVPEGC